MGGATDGQIVIVQIIQQPSFRHQAIGKVTDIIGDHMAPGMEIEMSIHNHGLPYEWPDGVEDEAARLGGEVKKKDKEGRIDLRSIPLAPGEEEKILTEVSTVKLELNGNSSSLMVAGHARA